MENYVLLDSYGNLQQITKDGVPSFVSHHNVKASWLFGGMCVGEKTSAINYMAIEFLDGTREKIQFEDKKDLIEKTNTLLSNK